MYAQQIHGFGQPNPATKCTAFVNDLQKFSTAIARHYASSELKRNLKVEAVRCRPDGKVCEVTFPGKIVVGVSFVRLPACVIARQMYSPQGAPRREYNYACTASGKLVLTRRPDFVSIRLIDPTGVFRSFDELRTRFMAGLQAKFNKLDSNWLKQNFFVFKVTYTTREPSSQEKAAFGRLDFPVYLLDKQHGAKTVTDLMKEHQIPKLINNNDIYKIAKDAWESDDTRGIGIPSGNGYRKAAFIKTHRVFEDAHGDQALAFVNATAHEIGHTGNRMQHSKMGLMKYPVPLNQAIDFARDDKYLFLTNLVRLRALRE